MQHTPNTDEQYPNIVTPAQGNGRSDTAREIFALLGRAADLAASMGIELDVWMKNAWTAYVDARPGFRQQLEDMQLIAQLTALRQRGQIGQA